MATVLHLLLAEDREKIDILHGGKRTAGSASLLKVINSMLKFSVFTHFLLVISTRTSCCRFLHDVVQSVCDCGWLSFN